MWSIIFLYIIVTTSAFRVRRSNNFTNNYIASQVVDGLGQPIEVKYKYGLPDNLAKYRGALENEECYQQYRDALVDISADFREAANSGDLGGLSNNVLRAVKNIFIASLKSSAISTLKSQSIGAFQPQLSALLNSEIIDCNGAINILANINQQNLEDIINNIPNTGLLFGDNVGVQRAVIFAALPRNPFGLPQMSETDSIEVFSDTLNQFTSLSSEELTRIKFFLDGASALMIRSLGITSTRAEDVKQVLSAFDPDTDWSKNMYMCQAVMFTVGETIGDNLNKWDGDDIDVASEVYPFLGCLALERLTERSLTYAYVLPTRNKQPVVFDYPHGTTMMANILGQNREDINTNKFINLQSYTKYITVRALQMDQSNSDEIVKSATLKAILQYNRDPLVLHYLVTKVLANRGDDNQERLKRLGAITPGLCVADIDFFFFDNLIVERIEIFQVPNINPGVMIRIVEIYFQRTQGILTSSDIRNLGELLPAVSYRRLNTAKNVAITDAIDTFKTHVDNLNSAQRFIIANKLQTDQGMSTNTLIFKLGPKLSAALSTNLWFEKIQNFEDFGLVVATSTGRVDTSAESSINSFDDWNAFQVAIFYKIYKSILGSTSQWRLKSRLVENLGTILRGVETRDIANAFYTDIVGVAALVMRNGADMNKAWLLAQQIRKAYTYLYNLKDVDEFHLALIDERELAALNGLILRQFSIREMEKLKREVCNEIIGKIGDLDDNYLIPPPRKRELVCFYFERCRLVQLNNEFVQPARDFSQLRSDILRAARGQSYCPLMTYERMNRARLSQLDFDTLGNLVCFMPAVVYRDVDQIVLRENFWKYSKDCFLDSDVATQIVRKMGDPISWADTTITDLGQSFCSVVRFEKVTRMASGPFAKWRIADFVQYAYAGGREKERSRRYLDRSKFWFRGVSRGAQSAIRSCYYEASRISVRIAAFQERVNRYYDPRIQNSKIVRNNIQGEIKFNCLSILLYGASARIWQFNQLRFLENQELANCMYLLGNNRNMTFDQRVIIRDKITESFINGWANIPSEYLVQLESIATTLRLDQLETLNLSNVHIIDAVSQWDWNPFQREVLFQNAKTQLLKASANDDDSIDYQRVLTSAELKALGEFFCGMSVSEISQISYDQFYELLYHIGQLTTCSFNRLRPLLGKARSRYTFGPIESWDESKVIALGSIVAGMSANQFSQLIPQSRGVNRKDMNLVAAIRPHAIPLIPVTILELIEPNFFEYMVPEQVIALTPRQWHYMSNAQASRAMDIWFSKDRWPGYYLKNLREAGAIKEKFVFSLALFIYFVNNVVL